MTECIVCNYPTVVQFLELGETALANKFLTKEELSQQEEKYPLNVGFCQTCGHVQLIEGVLPKVMFEDYLYISSTSDTLKKHLYDLSHILVERYHLQSDHLVMDIGCNDGTLLSGFQRYGVKTLGIDPAQNLAEFTDKMGIDRYVGFFNSQTAQEIIKKWGQASVVTATNTFPHIPALADFLEGIKTVLRTDGVFVIEAHYLVDLLEQVAFDTVYHEHISYWALGPMSYLFERHGMQIVDVERLPIHHGQLRVFVQHQGQGIVKPGVAQVLEMEIEKGIGKFETYKNFDQQVQQIKQDLKSTLENLLAQKKRVVGYGAPAKGNTLLSFLEIGPDTIEYIVDRSHLKQNRYTPGTHIPVVSPERLIEEQPDYVVLLAWNFAEEIMEQQAEYRKRGGKFIIPVPKVAIL